MTALKLWPVLQYRMALLHRSGCNLGIPKFLGPCLTLWMAHRTNSPSETASPKQRYRVTNWPDYNRALVSRGAVTLWIDEAVLSGWRASGGKRYNDVAILRAVFTMPLSQTEGFRTRLKNLLGPKIPVPHYSTLARRAASYA